MDSRSGVPKRFMVPAAEPALNPHGCREPSESGSRGRKAGEEGRGVNAARVQGNPARKVKPTSGLEPLTPSLRVKCSTS